MLSEKGNALVYRFEKEILEIAPHGKNGFRVRATRLPSFREDDVCSALTEPVETPKAEIVIDEKEADITSGKISAHIGIGGKITFYRLTGGEKKVILEEMYRKSTVPNESVSCLNLAARDFYGNPGGSYRLCVRFEGREGEKLYGMGQYQQSFADIKGCSFEIMQRNAQVTIPFVLSSLGYGFLWNTPAIGRATFARNGTEWRFDDENQVDYYICVGDTPREIVETYTAAVGRATPLPSDLLGFWQCKLRYHSSEEVLSVASEYHRRGIPLDVIVIDYFHWTKFGDWKFDPAFFPDPRELTEKLAAMGTKLMVSVWPAVEQNSENYNTLKNNGWLVEADRGLPIHTGFCNLAFVDMTNPEARAFVLSKLKQNYSDNGVSLFWLDCAEPEFRGYNADIYRYMAGNALSCGNRFPKDYTSMIYDGFPGENKISLVRSAWTGSQKYGALVWSGDIKSTFASLRNQVAAGIHIGLCGIANWTTDTGGFLHGKVDTPEFRELRVRWFEYSVFCPVLRLHGDRSATGYAYSTAPNEIWSFGEENYEILKNQIEFRLSMKDYIAAISDEANKTGLPIIRAMFLEFPDDPACYDLADQYMFGSRYLVAPILEAGARARDVYLPAGKWKNIHTGEIITVDGGKTLSVAAPIEYIPVFERI